MKKNYRIFLFALLFSACLWLYINLNFSYIIDISIPVEVTSASALGLTEEIPQQIEVKLKGRGWEVLNIILSKNLKYNLDLSRLKKDTRIITDQFVNERLDLSSNVSVISIRPDTIYISFDKVIEKYVKVRSYIVVKPSEGYSIIGEGNFSPDSVLVRGAQSIIRKINFIPTEQKIFDDVNSDISGIINIKDTLNNLVRITPTRINYTYKIQLSAEKNLEAIDVKILNIPSDKEVLLIPPKINLSLRGGVEQLSNITPDQINAHVEFEMIEQDTLGFVIPKIDIPSDVTVLKIEPGKLQYIIKKKL